MIDEDKIKDIADAIISHGLRQAGYEFLNIDDCWASDRSAQGTLTADPVQFPSGMKAIADYLHADGLKAGIYASVAATTCGGRPGSLGHAVADANSFAAWGYDYVKVADCGVQPSAAWTEWSDALKQTRRDMTFSVAASDLNTVTWWAPSIAHLWRTAENIQPLWETILKIVDANATFAPLAGPARWNDPDALQLGPGLTYIQNKTYFSLWAMMAAPLILTNDVRTMDAELTSLVTNAEVISVDQDPLGYQGYREQTDGIAEVWVKPLQGSGVRAVALVNRGEIAVTISVD